MPRTKNPQIESIPEAVEAMSWKKPFVRPVRFAVSGGLATATHWLAMAVLIYAGATPLTATATGAFIGAIVNYILQRNVTFESSAAHRSTLPRYLGVTALSWFANLVLFLVLHRIVLLSPVAAQGVTTFAVALMSYLLYRRVVFSDRQSQPV